jgi:hypothetical protein
MNTIPTVGPDTAIAPRTGSGSPQTPSQQRADAAPSVLADNPATAADPGVMLKITPPVQPRQGDSKITEYGPNNALSEWASLISDPDVLQVAALAGSAKEADEAVQNRVAQAFAALPPDVQEAIRLASTPAIAKLLRLAAITAPGIKDAPAVLQTGMVPMGQEVNEAIQAFRQVLQQLPPFQLAQLLQEFAGLRSSQPGGAVQFSGVGVQGGQQEVMEQLQRTVNGSTDIAQPHTRLNQTQQSITQPGQLQQALIQQSLHGAEAAVRGYPASQVEPTVGSEMAQVEGQKLQTAPTPSMPQTLMAINAQTQHQHAEQLAVVQQGMQSWLASTQQGHSQQATEQQALQPPRDMSQGQGLMGSQLHGLVAPQMQHTEAAIRDGLRLLMDGRMLWQGQFTPGVPMQFERSDTWRTNRRTLGGMEKGTSLKVRLQLPNIGPLEVRAMGFGGQVSVRLHAVSDVTQTVANALPELQTRLKERGLAGAQVLVDSL